MIRAVRAFLSLVWRLACVLGGWLMRGLAVLFLAIASFFRGIGAWHHRAAEWLFARANRIAATGSGSATGSGGA